jgi:transposase
MKNRYLKGAHISERKVRELLKLFSDDLTATQIANITGVSRITINAYLKMIRTHISLHCDERLPIADRSFVSSPAMAHLMPTETPPDVIPADINFKKPLYGVYMNDDTIKARKITAADQQQIVEWLKSGGAKNTDVIAQFSLGRYEALIDFNSVKLYRIINGVPRPISLKGPVDDIELFWSMLKARLVKFRGLNGNTLYLHVKETEFRFNHRNDDIFDLLVSIFHHRPLHVAREHSGTAN